MSIKKEIDKLSKATKTSRNIKEAIDKYSGTTTKSKTIREAISKLNKEEPYDSAFQLTSYETYQTINDPNIPPIEMQYNNGRPNNEY